MKKLKWYHWVLLVIWLGGLIFAEAWVYCDCIKLWKMIAVMFAILCGAIVILGIGIELFRAPTIDDKYMDITLE